MTYYRFAEPPFRLSRLLQIEREQREEIMQTLEIFDKKLVEINACCLMPNHFHLLLKLLTDGVITSFVKHLTDSYTRYYNTKNGRVGPLFQGIFKAVHIETNEQLLHVSRYIHLTPLVSFVVSEANFNSYPWSSLQDYREGKNGFITTQPILGQFKTSEAYMRFVMDQADYGLQLEKIKHVIFD
jgi:putative transposase